MKSRIFKKTFGITMAAFVFCSLVFSTTSVFAANNTKLTFESNASNVKAGEEFEVAVKIDNNVEGGIVTFEGNTKYDSSKVQLVEANLDLLKAWESLTIVNTNTPGIVRVVGTSTTPIKKSGNLFTMKFKALVNVSGKAAFSLEDLVVNDKDGNDITTDLQISDNTNVSVIIPITGITLNKTQLNLKKGDNSTLVVTKAPANTTSTAAVKFTSSDEKVAKVDANGKVTAIGGGKATITAEVEGKKATCAVNVTVPLNSFVIEGGNVKMPIKSTKALSLTLNPTDATVLANDFTWKSSDENVVKVEQDGKITILAEGKANVTATLKSDTSNKAEIEVEGYKVHINKVSINRDELGKDGIKIGEQCKLSCVINPDDVTDDYTATWKSSDETVATIDENGNITALKEGNVKFTLTVIDENDEKYSDTIETYVKPAEVKKVDSPDTSDINIALIGVMMMATLTAIVFVLRRKKALSK